MNITVLICRKLGNFHSNALDPLSTNLPLRRQLRVQQATVLNIFFLFSEKIRLDISCESSARQKIHIKHQAAYFLQKIKVKKTKESSAAILLGSLRVNPG